MTRVLDNPYIPQLPTERQWTLLLDNQKEILFGGSAGPGKTSALLMAALMYVDIPQYAAILFRRTFPNLTQANSLIPRSKKWLAGTNAKWNGSNHRWTFPSGATLTFGHLQYEDDRFDYNSAEYQFIGFDEICEFLETQFTFLFSRLRRTEDNPVPLRFRAAGNPIGPGFWWVKSRYIEGDKRYIPARLEDNPHVRRKEYEENLQNLDPVTREKVLNGDWEVVEPGEKFQPQWFEIIDEVPDNFDQVVRYWDLAGTEEQAGNDPDYTAGCKIGRKGGLFVVLDMIHERLSAGSVENLVRTVAQEDGTGVPVWIEQEPGQSGKAQIENYKSEVMPEFIVKGENPTGPKEVRADPVAAKAENGDLVLKRGSWNKDFLDEARTFPGEGQGMHDDQIDALSGAYRQLVGDSGPRIR